jgi:acetylglutamate/LysW-gamma-L-alpha-aminoadipate kinase
MALKLIAAREALAGGVASVRIGDGRTPEPVSRTLAGAGTTVHLSRRESPNYSSREREIRI